MPQQQEVVIVAKDGTEHVFPPGFDPKRAAEIVRTKDAWAAPAPEPSTLSRIGNAVGDVAEGVTAGAKRTIYGGGDLIRRGLGMERIIDKPEVQQAMTPPPSTAGRIGYMGEQVGEFFLPVPTPAKYAKAADVVKSGVLTLAQTGSPTTAGVSAGLTAAIPGAQALRRAGGALQESAEKSVVQALGPTKEAMKDTAAELAPEMLRRGVRGSRPAMLEQARGQVREIGKKIEAEIAAAAEAGQTVNAQAIRAAIGRARSGLTVARADGTPIVIEGAQPVVARLDRLDQFVSSLGNEITFDRAAKIKTVWDRIVSKAGLYGPKAASSATDSGNAWAIREAATAFRQLLAKGSPTLDDLNKEYRFWKGLKTVLTETERRTQSHGSGLVAGMSGSAGAAAGFATGEGTGDRFEKALMGGLAGRHLVKLLQSPSWRTQVSAPMKHKLAEALASGNEGRVLDATKKILASLPAQVARPTPAY